MVSHYGRRRGIHPGHHTAHDPAHVLSDGPAHSHTGHHGNRVYPTASVHRAGTPHLPKSLRPGDSYLGLLVQPVGLQMLRLGFQPLCILGLLPGRLENARQILCFQCLYIPHSLYIHICLGLCLCYCKVLCHRFQLLIPIAGLIQFNGRYIHLGDKDTEVGGQLLFQTLFYQSIDFRQFALNLHYRDTVLFGNVGHNAFHRLDHRIPDLTPKILQVKVFQLMQSDKLLIVRNLKADAPPHRHRHPEIQKTGVEQIKIGNAEFHLEQLGQIDKIDLRLKGAVAVIKAPQKACENGEVPRLQNHITGTLYVLLYIALRLRIDQNRHRTLLHPQRRPPPNGVGPSALLRVRPRRVPFPNQIGGLITADNVHKAAIFFVKKAHQSPSSTSFIARSISRNNISLLVSHSCAFLSSSFMLERYSL